MERYLSTLFFFIALYQGLPFIPTSPLPPPSPKGQPMCGIHKAIKRIVKCTYRGTWNKAKAISQDICWPHTGHQKAGLVHLNWLLDHVNIVHKHESLFMVVYYLWPWIFHVCASQKLMTPIINNGCTKQIDFSLCNVFTNLKRNMTLIVLRIKSLCFLSWKSGKTVDSLQKNCLKLQITSVWAGEEGLCGRSMTMSV